MLARSIVAPVLAILLAASGASECENGSSGGGGGSGGGTGRCYLDARINGKGGLVVGGVTASCLRAPQSFHLTLDLEYAHEGTAWEKQRTDRTDRKPSFGRSVFLELKQMCFKGRWRAFAHATGRGSGGGNSTSTTRRSST